jgi:fucose permease
MTTVLKYNYSWSTAYKSLSTLQYLIAFILFLSLSFWLNDTNNTTTNKPKVTFDLRMIYGIALFFLYVGIELSVGLWTNSYLVEEIKLLPSVSGYIIASYYGSIMSGRFLSGIISNRFGNRNMIRLGLFLSGLGAFLLIINKDIQLIRFSIILIGLGFAPLYPSMMHETPRRFKEEQANVLISYQVGIAYIGGTIISTGLGYLFNPLGISILYPIIFCFILFMFIISEVYNHVTPKQGH